MNRYWRVASDDLPFPVLFAAFGRMAWACLLGVALSIAIEDPSGCGYGLPMYLGFSVMFVFLSILNSIAIGYIGMQGSIFETEKREGVTTHLYISGVLKFLEGCCAIFGLIIAVIRYRFPCFENEDQLDLLLISIVVISQIVDIIVGSCFWYSAYSHPVDGITNEGYDDDAMNIIWSKRCSKFIGALQCCFCNIIGGTRINTEEIEEVAKVLTSFFHHDGFLDIVPGDAFAGLLLVRLQQRQESAMMFEKNQSNPLIESNKDKLSGKSILSRASSTQSCASSDLDDIHLKINSSPSSSPTKGCDGDVEHGFRLVGNQHSQGTVRREATLTEQARRRKLDQNNEDDKNLIEIMNDLMPYSLAIYTTLFLAITNPCTCFCRICYTGLGNCGKHDNDIIQGDEYGHHKAAALHHLQKANIDEKKSELLYGNFGNDVLLSPFCIFHEFDKKRIIIVLRGTLSLEDAITDALAATVEMKKAGEKWGFDGKDRFVHQGYLESAMFIRQQIEDTHILDKFFATKGDDNAAPEFELYVTGHSLGGALSSLLGYLLKPKYPYVKCVSFAPPALVLDQRTAEETSDFITSVVLGEDAVPYTNLQTLSHLRERVLNALSRAKVNKSKILQTIFKDFEVDELMYDEGKQPENKYTDIINKFNEKIEEKNSMNDHVPQCAIPGRIIHFVRNEDTVSTSCPCYNGKCNYSFTPYETKWSAFLEIPVTKFVLAHHMPDNYLYRIRNVHDIWIGDEEEDKTE